MSVTFIIYQVRLVKKTFVGLDLFLMSSLMSFVMHKQTRATNVIL